ncbi:MAG: response regulator transcription factor [Oscillospiraceae bacterium]|nr:response regulator transcription factor [Oscillospiraceae bacterium]
MANERILIVEDELSLLRANMDFLTDLGYEVRAASTLADARRLLREAPPDLVLLDVMLPDGSGFDFSVVVRQLSNSPVIFITALSDLKDEERGFALGGDDYLIKPYDLNRLGIRVAAILRRAMYVGSGRAEIPPLSVDPSSGLCRLDGENVVLSPMEMRLLHYFMKNPNMMIHREKVYEDVWGASALDNAQTVVEHVYRLRKKLHMTDNPDSWFRISSEKQSYMFSKIRY